MEGSGWSFISGNSLLSVATIIRSILLSILETLLVNMSVSCLPKYFQSEFLIIIFCTLLVKVSELSSIEIHIWSCIFCKVSLTNFVISTSSFLALLDVSSEGLAGVSSEGLSGVPGSEDCRFLLAVPAILMREPIVCASNPPEILLVLTFSWLFKLFII